MNTFSKDVELAIELGAHDIAKAISDRYATDYSKVHRNINAMVRAAARSTCTESGAWVLQDKGEGEWIRNAAPATALDAAALDRALGRWWDSMDEKGKLALIMQTHKPTEFLGNLKQKYESNPDKLGQEHPDLSKIYEEEANPSRVPVPSATPSETQNG